MYNSCVYQSRLNVNHGYQTTDKHKYIVYLSALSVAWHLICLHYPKMLICIYQFIHIQSHNQHHNPPHTVTNKERNQFSCPHHANILQRLSPNQIAAIQQNREKLSGLPTGQTPHLAPPRQTMNRSAYLAAAGLTHLNQIRNQHQQQHNDPKKRCY